MLVAYCVTLVSATNLPRVFSPKPLGSGEDRDGWAKLVMIEQDLSARTALSWFVGDDPQGVHTFRPIPAFLLWAEFHLWGWNRAAYQFVNWVLFTVTAFALALLVERFGLTLGAGALVGACFCWSPSQPQWTLLRSVATLHDALCVLFGLLAALQLFRYLSNGRCRNLFLLSSLLMLSFLCKEMAVVFLPLFLAWSFISPRNSELKARALRALLATVGVTMFWFVWYRLALSGGSHVVPDCHSFEGLWGMLRARWRNSLWLFVGNLFPPLYASLNAIRCIPDGWILLQPVFYKPLFDSLLMLLEIAVLWRWQRRVLFYVYTWAAITYLPVLPLDATFYHYLYMPNLLEPLRDGVVLWCLVIHRSEVARMAQLFYGRVRGFGHWRT